jgi:hypothetical protein
LIFLPSERRSEGEFLVAIDAVALIITSKVRPNQRFSKTASRPFDSKYIASAAAKSDVNLKYDRVSSAQSGRVSRLKSSALNKCSAVAGDNNAIRSTGK